MKITLTHAELAALVRNRYGLPSDFELEISGYSGLDNPDATRLLDALNREKCLSPAGAILYDKKIQSIKLLRDLVSAAGPDTCGLAQAKYAIEDFGNFLNFVRKNGFPPMGSNAPDRGWLGKI